MKEEVRVEMRMSDDICLIEMQTTGDDRSYQIWVSVGQSMAMHCTRCSGGVEWRHIMLLGCVCGAISDRG
jgi:hypothetical protein